METFTTPVLEPLSNSHCMSQKKKYSKVNEALRTRFLEFIIQNNMSIKQASLNLNINYSSAKAILAQHRKTIIHSNKVTSKCNKRAQFKILNPFEGCQNPIEEFICTTGGKEVRRQITKLKHKPIHKAPIIVLAVRKDYQSLQNTSNSQNQFA